MTRSVREFLWVAFPKVSSAALQLVTSVMLLRSFGPEQYGVYAVCLNIIILSDAVLGAATDSAILRQAPIYKTNEPKLSLQVQQAGLILKPAFWLVAALPIFFASPFLSALLFHGRGNSRVLCLSAFAVLGLLILRSVQAHFQVDRNFRRYGVSDMLHAAGRYGSIAALLGLHSATTERVIAIYAGVPVAVSLILLVTLARPLLLVPFSRVALAEVLHLLKIYLPTAAIGSTTSRMDMIFVTSCASVAQAGIFAAAQTLILAPQLVGTYLSVIFSPRVMPLWETGELRAIHRKFQRCVMIGSCLAYLVALVAMNRIVSTLFPASFRGATGLALILLPAGLAAFISFPWNVSLLLFLRPKFLLKFDGFSLPVLAVLYAVVVPRAGAVGAAYVTVVFALLKAASIQMVARKELRRPLSMAGEILADAGVRLRAADQTI